LKAKEPGRVVFKWVCQAEAQKEAQQSSRTGCGQGGSWQGKRPGWQLKRAALRISLRGGGPGLQGPWPIAWHCWGLSVTAGTSKV